MKPLSVINYSKNNKKKVIVAISCICVSVFLLYTFQIIFSTLGNTVNFIYFQPLSKGSQVLPAGKSKTISDKLTADILKQNAVERVIPIKCGYTLFFNLAWDNGTPVYSIKKEDMAFFMKKLEVTLKAGRLPAGSDEVVLDYRVAANKGLKIGDKFGHSVNKTESFPGEYTLVGLLQGTCAANIIPYDSSVPDNELVKYGMFIFIKDGQYDLLNKYLESIPKSEASVVTYPSEKASVEKYVLKSANTIINLIIVLAIAVMSISVGNSTYVHFLERRKEFGILGALGYSELDIIKKATLEITFMNITGFIAGIALAMISGQLLQKLYFSTQGLTADFWIPEAIFQAFCIPVFTTLFSVVPIYRLIRRIDPINIIEGVN